MNGPLIVVMAAFLLVLPQFSNANAAGPYDGEWTGTATATRQRCKQAVVTLTVEGQVVLGQARFERDAPNINGTVDEGGAFGATIGFQPFKGQFTRDEFEGTFKIFDCEWKALLRRTKLRPCALSRARPSIRRWRRNRFKDFWWEWAESAGRPGGGFTAVGLSYACPIANRPSQREEA